MTGLALVSTTYQPAYSHTYSGYTRDAVQSDAFTLLDLIDQRFAYADRFPGRYPPTRAELSGLIYSLNTREDLIAFSQLAFHTLYDHHSITSAGLCDAHALVPSFADLWIEKTDAGYEVADVRQGSPALRIGIRPGCLLTEIDGQYIDQAVADFIGPYPTVLNDERRAYAARVLAAGRRDRYRRLGFICDGMPVRMELPNLYQARIQRDKGLVSVETRFVNGRTIAIIRFNDSLGLPQTVGAFDQAIAGLGYVDGLVLDLRDTASGGNTLVARGILSRFVTRTTAYQRHILPSDLRDFGVRRSWLEEVSPRGHFIDLPTAVVSGRWTASMGEGLTVAFDALGKATFGSDMAGLLGGITDHRLPETGVMVKLTTERLQHVDGTPREFFQPRNLFNYADAPGIFGGDGPMDAALAHVADQSAHW